MAVFLDSNDVSIVAVVCLDDLRRFGVVGSSRILCTYVHVPKND